MIPTYLEVGLTSGGNVPTQYLSRLNRYELNNIALSHHVPMLF